MYAAPQPRRRSGFWGGCLVGGCLVLILEVVVVAGAGVLLGAAASSALTSANQSLINILPSSEPCTPHPCLAHGGLELIVANLNRNAGAAAPAPNPASPLHRVKMDVTFAALSGDHDVTSVITLRDSTNAIHAQATGTGCSDFPSGSLPAGQRLGPNSICFDVAGNPKDVLALDWVPSEGGSLTVLELKL